MGTAQKPLAPQLAGPPGIRRSVEGSKPGLTQLKIVVRRGRVFSFLVGMPRKLRFVPPTQSLAAPSKAASCSGPDPCSVARTSAARSHFKFLDSGAATRCPPFGQRGSDRPGAGGDPALHSTTPVRRDARLSFAWGRPLADPLLVPPVAGALSGAHWALVESHRKRGGACPRANRSVRFSESRPLCPAIRNTDRGAPFPVGSSPPALPFVAG